MLEIRNLKVAYHKKTIIEDFNANFKNGKITCLIGRNGAGKTTLIKAILKSLKYTGDIYIDSKNIKDLTGEDLAREIAYVPQSSEIGYNFSVKEFIGLSNKNGNLNAVIQLLGLERISNSNINELSGGELKLCYLARALNQNANWLILDEPNNSLDYQNEYDFYEIIKNIRDKQNKSIIMIIHNPITALEIADEFIFMDRGNCLASLSKDDKDSLVEAFRKIYSADLVNKIMKGDFNYEI